MAAGRHARGEWGYYFKATAVRPWTTPISRQCEFSPKLRHPWTSGPAVLTLIPPRQLASL